MTEEYYEEQEPQENPEESEEDTGDDSTGEAEQPDKDAEIERLKAELEKVRKDKNGILAKAKATKAPDDSRFDKLELRILDKDLNSDQVNEILSYKKARGISIDEAYSSRIIQAFLKEERAEKEHEAKIKSATPKGNNRVNVSKSEGKSFPLQNISNREMSTQSVALELMNRFELP